MFKPMLSMTMRLVLICIVASLLQACQAKVLESGPQVGAGRYALYAELLVGKRIGLVVNQTSKVGGQHLVDFLLERGVDVKMIFAPEHGFRGDVDAGAYVDNSVDIKTGITIQSLYGAHKKPTSRSLEQLDLIIFDIQDVGLRYYTYISSMHYMMEAAAETGKLFLVLDRPNPNGRFVDGPVLEAKFRSFVGMHPIPVLHGLTIAELARMIEGERWLDTDRPLELVTVPVANYTRQDLYELPVKPSPNLPNAAAIRLYPALCFFEATPVSIGRGTQLPFQVVGYDQLIMGDYEFTPVSMPGSALKPKLMNKALLGEDLRESSIEGLDLRLFVRWQQAFTEAGLTFFDNPTFMDKLAGTDKLRLALLAGIPLSEIQQSWQENLANFRDARLPYLLYPE